MLYMPGIFGEDLMDRWMNDMDRQVALMEKPLYGHHAKNLMKTDVREHEDGYEVEVELPGFHKDEVELSLENGYLTITAAKGLDKDEKDKKSGQVIRQERYAGSLRRRLDSFVADTPMTPMEARVLQFVAAAHSAVYQKDLEQEYHNNQRRMHQYYLFHFESY